MATIDRNVVEMRFDNDQFESGVSQTLTSIDKLKQALNFKDKNTGLEELAQTTSTMDMSRLEASAIAVQNKFSALGTIGDQVLRRLTDGALTAAKSLINMINAPLNQIKTGGWSRAMNIDNAQFSLEGLGIEWNSINKDLQYAVNQTAYGLDAAAMAASQLVASGVEVASTLKNLNASNVDECAAKFKGMSAAALIADGELDQMSVALRAISGVASQTNSEYTDIANVFTRVAGQGRVMASDLNSLASRGMNAAATIGNAIGKTEAEVREMVSDGKISFEMFSEAMYDAFADHAIEANNTFTGALANMKAALSKIGADFYQPLLDELPALFNSIRININGIRSAVQPFIEVVNQVLKISIETLSNFFNDLAEKTSVVQNIFTGLGNVLIGVASVLTPIIIAFKNVYNIVGEDILSAAESASEAFLNFSKSLTITDEAADKITQVATGLFTALKTLGNVIGTVCSTIINIGVQAVKIIFSIAGGLAELGINASAAGRPLDSLRIIFEKVSGALKEFKDNIGDTLSKVKDLEGVKKLTEAFKEFKKVIVDAAFDKISAKFKSFAEALNIKIPKFDGVLKVIDAITSRLADFINLLTTAKKSVKTNVDDISKSFSVFDTIKDYANKAISGISAVLKEFRDILDGGITSALKGLANGWVGSIKALASSSNTMSVLSTGMTTLVGFVEKCGTQFQLFLGKIQLVIQQLGISVGSMLSSMAIGIGAMGTALLVYNQIQAKNIFLIAAGIGILSLSMIALSSVPGDKLAIIATSMAIAFTVLAGALYILNKRAKSVGDVIQAGVFSKLFDTITTVISSFGLATKIAAIGSYIKSFAISMAILSAAIYALAQCDPVHLLAGTTVLIVLLGVVYEITDRLIDKVSKVDSVIGDFLAIGVGILLIASAVGTLAASVSKMTALIDKGPLKTVAGLMVTIVMLGSLVLAAEALSNIPSGGASKIIGAAAGLIVLGTAIKVLSSSVSQMSALAASPWQLVGGLVSVATMMYALLVAAEALSKLPDDGAGKIIAASAGILVLSTAIKIISSAVSTMGSMDLTSLAKGLGGLTVVLYELIVAAGTLSKVGGGKSLAGAAAILLISVALNNLVVPLAALGSMSWGSIIKGLTTFGAALAIIIVAGGVAQVVATGLLVLSGAILAIGVGTLAAGVGVLAFATGLNVLNVALASLAAMAPAQINSVIMSFTTLVSGIASSIASIGVSLVAAVTTIIASIIQGIANNLTNITELIAQILDAVLGIIVTYGPKIIETAVVIIMSLIQTLAAHAQDFVTAGMNFIIGLINGFASRVGDLVQAGWDAVIALIDAMTDGFAQNSDRFREAVMNLIAAVADFLLGEGAGDFLKAGQALIDGMIAGFWEMATDAVNAIGDIITDIVDGIGEFVGNFVTAGKNLLAGFIEGITDGNGDAYDGGTELASSAERGITDEADINSPSKVTYGYGQNIGDGMINGMTDKQGAAYTSGGDLAQSAVNGASDVVDKGKKLINEKLQSLYESSETFRNYADKYGDALGFFTSSEEDTTESTNDLTEAIKEATEATDDATESTSKSSSATKSSSSSTKDAASKAKELAEEQERVRKYTDYATKSMTQFMNIMGQAMSFDTDSLILNAKEQFGELAEQLYQDTLKESDTIEDVTQTAEERAKAVQNAFIEAFENVRDAAKDALVFDSSFSKNLSDSISVKEMIANFKSQSSGITSFYERLGTLAGKGFNYGIIKDLMEEGTSAYPKVSSMLKATTEQIQEMNAAWDSKETIANQSAALAMTSLMTAMTIQKLKSMDVKYKELNTTTNDALKNYKAKIQEAQESGADMEEVLNKVAAAAGDTSIAIAESGPERELFDAYQELQKTMKELEYTNEDLQEAMMNDNGFEYTENTVLTIMRRISDLQSIIAQFDDIGTTIFDNVKSQLSSSISYFDEWSAKYEMTGETLMKNVQSQIEGVAKYNANIQTIIKNGGQDIVSLFGDKITPDIANAMAQLGTDALNTLKERLVLLQEAPVAGATAAQASWLKYGQIGGMGYQEAITQLAQNQELLNQTQTIGTNVGQGLANGMQESTTTVNTEAQNLGQAAVDGVATGAGTHSPSTKTHQIGQYLDQGLMNGIRSMSETTSTTARLVAERVVSTVRQVITTHKFSEIGKNICRGMIEGINSESGSVANAARAMAESAYAAALSALSIHSPSRKMAWAGRMFDAGFAEGVDDGSASMQNSIVSTMQDALQTAVDLMDSTGDMQPTIRPVIDLSDAQNGSRLLSSMFNDIGPMRVGANIGQIVTPTDRMNAAIQGMNGSTVTNGDTNLYIYGAQGQDVNKLADVVIKRLNNEYARRKAAWS